MCKIKIVNKRKFALFLLSIAVITGVVLAGIYMYKKTHPKTLYGMSFAQAGQKGEKKTYQAAIKINKNGGNGGYDRGDVIMTAPEDKQWSRAEQEGFLIIKISLTEDQAALLVMPKGDPVKEIKEMEKTKSKPDANPATQQPQERRFAVDLAKIGIAPDEERGKVILDKVFEGKEIIAEKK